MCEEFWNLHAKKQALPNSFVSNPTNRLPHATLQRYVGTEGRDAGSLCFLPDRFGFNPDTYRRLFICLFP